MVNKPLIRPYFWGGYVRGGWLNSHDGSQLGRQSIRCMKGTRMQPSRTKQSEQAGAQPMGDCFFFF